jgi:protein involved in polysaccharide export with SLBB domain
MRLLFAVLLSGCATALPRGDLVLRSVTQADEPRAVPGAKYLVKVLGDSQLDGEVRVSSDGTASFPLCGALKVLGLTVQEVEARLHECLAPWLRDPAVSVQVVDSGRAVVVLGELATRVKWEPGLTLINLLFQIGGEADALSLSGRDAAASGTARGR